MTMEELAKEHVESNSIVPPAIAERMGGPGAPSGHAGAKQDALRQLTEELSADSADSAGYVPAQALQALDSGDAEAALKLCERFDGEGSSATPLSVPLIRGRALLALERINEAAEEFHRILRLEPESPAALKGLGDTYFAQNKEVIAFTYYERARELSGSYQALAEQIRFVAPTPKLESESEPESESVAEPVSDATVGLAEVSSDEMTHVEAGLEEVALEGGALAEVGLEEIVVQESAPVATPQAARKAVSHHVDEVVESTDRAHVSMTLKRSAGEAVEVVETVEAEETEIASPDKAPASDSFEPAPQVTQMTRQDSISSGKKPKAAPVQRFDRPQRPVHYQTETMADLLLQQGYVDAALDILHVLVKDNPLPRLQEKLSRAGQHQKRR